MIRREVNRYIIETRGGGSFIKRWVVLCDDLELSKIYIDPYLKLVPK